MPRSFAAFGASVADFAAMAWLRRKGIDPADVRKFTIERSPQDSTITLVMMFDDDTVQDPNALGEFLRSMRTEE